MHTEQKISLFFLFGILPASLGYIQQHTILMYYGIGASIGLLCIYMLGFLSRSIQGQKKTEEQTKNTNTTQHISSYTMQTSQVQATPTIKQQTKTIQDTEENIHKNISQFRTTNTMSFGEKIHYFVRMYLFSWVFWLTCLYFIVAGFLYLPFIYGIYGSIVVVLLFIYIFKARRNKDVYRLGQMLLPKDIILGISLIIFGSISFVFQELIRRYKIFFASLLAMTFVIMTVKIFNLARPVRFWKLRLMRLYSFLLITTLLISALVIYRTADSLLVQSFTNKMGFIGEAIELVLVEAKQSVHYVIGTGISDNDIHDTDKPDNGIDQNFIETPIDQNNQNQTGQTGQNIDQNTGKIIINQTTGSISGTLDTSIIDDIRIEEQTEETPTTNTVDEDKTVTYREVLRYIFQDTSLLSNKQIAMNNINTNDPDYKYFATAADRGMIGKGQSPDTTIRCDTFIVIKGIRRGWKVTITNKQDPFTPYWNYAQKNNYLQGCEKGSFVKNKQLQ